MGRGRSESQGQLDLLLLAILSRGPEHGYSVVAALRAAHPYEEPAYDVYARVDA